MNVSALPKLLIGTALAIVIVGGVIAFISVQFELYLIIVFPILMAAIGGFLAAWWSKELPIDNRLLIAFLAVVLGLAIYGAYRFGEYLFVLNAAEISMSAMSFGEFLELSASMGMSIGDVGSGSGDMEFNEQSTQIFWLIEMAVIALTSIYFAFSSRKNSPLLNS
ncbi:MAG: hypothetical protein MUF87_11345 [Anaerolineae bacterium]|jgi:hypothetical protein|nr:hypothetical protein [Anaerolineae bacterium]